MKKNTILFIPYIVFLLCISLPYAIARLFDGYFVDYIYIIENYNQYLRLSQGIILLVFMSFGFIQFLKFKKILKCNYSTIEHNNFIWVRYLLLSVIIIISIDLLMAISQLLFDALPIRSQNISMALIAIALIYGAYFGINQTKVLVPYFLLEKESHTQNATNKTIDKLKETEFIDLKISLLAYIQNEKPYLDEELTLNKLAKAIKTTDKKLSFLLNQYMKTTFYSFINSYRVDEFKEYIASSSYKEYTIEAIAYECGFKSKASFYRLFKQETGLSR
ncbi:helix-turn-helix domain-containing protein [Aquimarina sp. 2201CG1-2-11]|uniref:helix-turn-helix domain-containing protein n=1 Tax=Aquimarina discodermiae TaxID=3231043 RepID=UPI0034630B30